MEGAMEMTPQSYLLFVIQVCADEYGGKANVSEIMHVVGWVGSTPVTAEQGLMAGIAGKLLYGATVEKVSQRATMYARLADGPRVDSPFGGRLR